MKKYIFAAVFVLLALIIIFTTNNETDAQTGTPSSTLSDAAAEEIPPQTVTTTVSDTLPAATQPPETSLTTEPDYKSAIVRTAEGLVGIEFAENGDRPDEGFDNSGFIYYVLRENGYINCPRQISAQVQWGSTTDITGIKAGDVLYFSEEPGGDASFGGIYAGGGIMIYSPYPGEKVKKTDISASYWQSRFVTALSL